MTSDSTNIVSQSDSTNCVSKYIRWIFFFAVRHLHAPLRHRCTVARVRKARVFLVAQLRSLPCFTDNFAARFSADASDLSLDVALQLSGFADHPPPFK